MNTPDADTRWMTGPNTLWILIVSAFAIAVLSLVRNDRMFSVWIWIALVGSFTRRIFIAQERRIRALEDEMSKLHR